MNSIRGIRLSCLLSVALSLSCDLLPKATGECTGSFMNQAVSWPIDSEITSYSISTSPRYGTKYVDVHLVYDQNKTDETGVYLELGANYVVDARTGPIDIVLKRQGPNMSNLDIESESKVVTSWQGYTGNSRGSGSGFQDPPGPPLEGTARIDALDDSRFAGHYVYRYEDGSELRCSFDIPR